MRPVADFELWGLVVSHNNPTAFYDIYHDRNSVDTRDLGVIWGENLRSADFIPYVAVRDDGQRGVGDDLPRQVVVRSALVLLRDGAGVDDEKIDAPVFERGQDPEDLALVVDPRPRLHR